MKKLYALIKRECLENKWRFFLVPIWTVVIFLVFFYIQIIILGFVSVDKVQTTVISKYEPSKIIPDMLFSLICTYLIINKVFYPLQALYQDRKDGSIAFYKSMPYSTNIELLSKFLTIVLLVPILFIIIIILSNLLTYPLISWLTGQNLSDIDTVSSSLFGSKTNIFVIELWCLPYTGYLFLCSSLAKRSPFFLAVTPCIIIATLETLIIGTDFFLKVISYPIFHYKMGFIFAIHDLYFWVSMLVACLFFLATVYVRKRFADPL